MPYVSLSWLKDHVKVAPGTTAADLAASLVSVGLEEERIVPPPVVGPLVVGKVLSMVPEAQSNGKTINYCRVDVGQFNDKPGEGPEPSHLASRSIVCGAHNFKEGDLVAVVLPGAILPGPFPIATRKTYGHVSDGMICSERELGLGDDHNGIMVLTDRFAPEDIPAVGESLLELFDFGEELLEINITPDRGYCFSMRGVAREYSHATGGAFTDPGLAVNLPGGSVPAATDDGFAVEIADEAPIRGNVGCDRFVTRIVTGVDPLAPSPQWMVKRLEAAGMRSISLAVDVTNYVMLDLGQPLHAYDLDKVVGPIVVRRGIEGEKHTTLDDVERTISAQDLLITDCQGGHGARVLGIAGVMGGADTEVTETTTNILVEAAHFDPISIARSARRHKLPTEASKRFERGVDTALQDVAAQRVVDLLVEYGGGTDSGRVSDVNNTVAPESIELPVGEAQRLVGIAYSREHIVELLTSIGCTVVDNGENLQVTPPTWRSDITGKAHLVEEVARLDGYDKIDSRIPRPQAGHGLSREQICRRDIARALADYGLTQVLSFPFINTEALDKQGIGDGDVRRTLVKVANPLSEDQPYLRTSVLDSLLSIAERNVARGMDDCAVFETGRVMRPAAMTPAATPGVDAKPSDEEIKALHKGVPLQPWHVAGVVCGNWVNPGAVTTARHVDWADALGAVKALCAAVGCEIKVASRDLRPPKEAWALSGAGTDATAVAPFHPGRCARIIVRGSTVGLAGELHPEVCKRFGLGARACAFEVDMDRVIAAARPDGFAIKDISTFPVAKEDLAFVVDASVEASQIEALLVKQLGDLYEDVRLFDVYQGEQLGANKKSLAFAIKMRSPEGTLKAKDIAAVRTRLISSVEKKFKAKLRS